MKTIYFYNLYFIFLIINQDIFNIYKILNFCLYMHTQINIFVIKTVTFLFLKLY